jgi:hypothetical protein
VSGTNQLSFLLKIKSFLSTTRCICAHDLKQVAKVKKSHFQPMVDLENKLTSESEAFLCACVWNNYISSYGS